MGRRDVEAVDKMALEKSLHPCTPGVMVEKDGQLR
jgi:hypothetical protein